MNTKTFTKLPIFGIYRADGTRYPSLKKSFLVKQWLTRKEIAEGKLRLDDGTEWNLVLEPAARMHLMRSINVYCICSYQVHHGDGIDAPKGNYVVARLCTEELAQNSTSFGKLTWPAPTMTPA